MNCCKRRQVKNCEQCCHYKNCYYQDHSPISKAELSLLCAIIREAIYDYKVAKRKNDTGKMYELERFLRLKADFYTNYSVSGDFILKQLKN